MLRRTLSLKREALAELTTDSLREVVGGVPETLNLRDCVRTFEYSCLNCISHPPCTID